MDFLSINLLKLRSHISTVGRGISCYVLEAASQLAISLNMWSTILFFRVRLVHDRWKLRYSLCIVFTNAINIFNLFALLFHCLIFG